jgi:hypothetical protein
MAASEMVVMRIRVLRSRGLGEVTLERVWFRGLDQVPGGCRSYLPAPPELLVTLYFEKNGRNSSSHPHFSGKHLLKIPNLSPTPVFSQN